MGNNSKNKIDNAAAARQHRTNQRKKEEKEKEKKRKRREKQNKTERRFEINESFQLSSEDILSFVFLQFHLAFE